MKIKLTAIIISVIIAMFGASSCSKSNYNSDTELNKQTATSDSENVTNPSTETHEILKTTEISEDIGCGTLSLTKYRSIYCDIPRPFINLVDLYEFQDWYENVIENDPNETNIMPMKLFIQDFDISREDFERANLEWAKIIVNGFDGEPMMNPQDFANQETDEVYNADIIYTFNDEIINNYYLSHDYPFVYVTDYENALETGTYETRTTDWIDIEQMEDDIIAKYGEAEIVSERIPPYEILAIDSSEFRITD